MNDRINKDARPALENLLSGLNRDQVQSLLLKLAEQEPSLIRSSRNKLHCCKPLHLSQQLLRNRLLQSHLLP